MTKTITIIFLGILAVASIGAVTGSFESYELAKAEYQSHEYSNYTGDSGGYRSTLMQAQNQTYQSECGDCHIAYQPGLLPGAAWNQILENLNNHYGDDASTDETVVAELGGYLSLNSATGEHADGTRTISSQPAKSGVLPRITESRFFRYEHHEIPVKFVKSNKEVGGFGNCQACHHNAESGVYDEDEVIIPGIGRWDD